MEKKLLLLFRLPWLLWVWWWGWEEGETVLTKMLLLMMGPLVLTRVKLLLTLLMLPTLVSAMVTGEGEGGI